MPVVLDTDPLSVLHWQERPACDRLLARPDRLPPGDIATMTMSFQEQVVGWLAYLDRARKPEDVVRAYLSKGLEGATPTFQVENDSLQMSKGPVPVGIAVLFHTPDEGHFGRIPQFVRA